MKWYMVHAMRVAVLILSLFPMLALSSSEKPNVLLLVANDLGWGDLSMNGNREVKTPNIDSLAEVGMSFSKFYACPEGPLTSASLLTGRYHFRTGVIGSHEPEAVMYGSEKTLPELFRENGYCTGLFGRWYHGENYPQNALGQGFEIQKEAQWRKVIDFLKDANDQPFYCQVNFAAPEVDELMPERGLEIIYNHIKSLDREIGRILGWIAANEKVEDTIVVFLSDNGPDFFGEREGRFNGNFYGGKGSVHEGGIRVPCFIAWPGRIDPGSRFTRITSVIDWYPTLMALCRLTSETRQLQIDGANLSSVILNSGNFEDWPNRILFNAWTPRGFDIRNTSVSVRTDRWLALRDPRWRRDPSVAKERSGWELYDLKTDPFQNHEMGDEYPFLLSELKADFAFWIDQTTDDGVGPVPTHLGHPEWSLVTLKKYPGIDNWKVRIITRGNYKFSAVGGENCKLKIGRAEPIEIQGSVSVELLEGIEEITWISGEISGVRVTYIGK